MAARSNNPRGPLHQLSAQFLFNPPAIALRVELHGGGAFLIGTVRFRPMDRNLTSDAQVSSISDASP